MMQTDALLDSIAKLKQENKRLRMELHLSSLMCDSLREDGSCIENGGNCFVVPASKCALIPKLQKRVEQVEKERDDALEMLHSYRHICGELAPQTVERIIQDALKENPNLKECVV